MWNRLFKNGKLRNGRKTVDRELRKIKILSPVYFFHWLVENTILLYTAELCLSIVKINTIWQFNKKMGR